MFVHINLVCAVDWQIQSLRNFRVGNILKDSFLKWLISCLKTKCDRHPRAYQPRSKYLNCQETSYHSTLYHLWLHCFTWTMYYACGCISQLPTPVEGSLRVPYIVDGRSELCPCESGHQKHGHQSTMPMQGVLPRGVCSVCRAVATNTAMCMNFSQFLRRLSWLHPWKSFLLTYSTLSKARRVLGQNPRTQPGSWNPSVGLG